MNAIVEALRNEYASLTNRAADKRWNETRLGQELAPLRERAANEKARREAEQAARAAYEAELKSNRERRGVAEDFVNMSRKNMTEDDKVLAFLMREPVNVVANEQDAKKKFIDSINSDPRNGLAWADGYFKQAARAEVASRIVDLFDEGMSYKELCDTIMRQAVNAAASRRSSTSQCSNLYDACVTEAWGDMAQRFYRQGL